MSGTQLLVGQERRRAPAALGPMSAALVVHLVNVERKRHGLKPVKRDRDLVRVAKARARQLDARNSMDGHAGWEPTLRRLGLWGTRALGENIAAGFRSSRSVHRAWMASPAHRDNVLRPEFTGLGVAASGGMWACEFGGR